jgi:hypothetical protein
MGGTLLVTILKQICLNRCDARHHTDCDKSASVAHSTGLYAWSAGTSTPPEHTNNNHPPWAPVCCQFFVSGCFAVLNFVVRRHHDMIPSYKKIQRETTGCSRCFAIFPSSCATRSSQRANLGFLFSLLLRSATIFLDGQTMTWSDRPKRSQRKTRYRQRDFCQFVGDTGGPPVSPIA